MHTQRWFAAAVGALAALGAIGTPASADLIIFKDGYIVQGKVKQPGTYEVDPRSQTGFWLAQGFFTIDAGARRVLFSHPQIQDVEPSDPAAEADLVQFENHFTRNSPAAMYPLVQIIGPDPWKGWERNLWIETGTGKVKIRQRLVLLTPKFARLDAVNYFLNSLYETRELGLDAIRELLANCPELKAKNDAVHRFRVSRFLTQAGYYDEAEKELDNILSNFPDEKTKVTAAKESLQKLRTLLLFEEIDRAHQAGRHRWAQEHLASFPAENADEKMLAKVRSLKAHYESTAANLALTQRYLKELLPQVDSADRPLFKEAVAAIEEELNTDNLARLEPFLDMAQQAERDQQQGRKPQNQPSQLLALAVSGWLQGKDSADAKIDSARRLWWARKLALEYQRTDSLALRQRLLRAYRGRSDAVAADEMAQLIGFLPPPLPEKPAGDEALSLATAPSTLWKNGISYLVQLPPEYQAGRSYPVVFALHLGGEKPKPMLDRVARVAGEHGYIVVAPAWGQPMEEAYNYSAAEHAAVVDVLRDVRRRLQVDSDRVFLLGYGQGGNMAYDVGLAHPDLFAGVVVVGGLPKRFVPRYWTNAQYLPLYLVDGTNSGDNPKNARVLLEKWLPSGYPVIYVEYKGRGIEWYEEELPYMFDWMDHKVGQKKRAQGFPDLGRSGNGGPLGQEFRTMRATDNHFYWLSTDSIGERHLLTDTWDPHVIAASLQGKIMEGNQINLNLRGLNKVTVWLGRDMVDFNKPITIRINGGVRLANYKVVPKLETLLDDLYQRGDRQRVFWAKVDFDRP